uniref:CIP2A N-terminal domain-containing protein n=1 Tax=Ciona intestinalis TaxID=7719 RepID=F6ZGU5_CIOIN
MEILASVKSLLLAVAQYRSCRSESTLSQLLRHIEVTLKTNEVDQIFNSYNTLGAECLSSIVELLSANDNDSHLVNKIFQLFNLIGKNYKNKELMTLTFNLTAALSAYIVKHAESSADSHNILQCLRLLERTTYGNCVPSSTAHLEKLLSFLLQQIDNLTGEYASVCLGVLSNLVAKNVTLQAQVKGMMGTHRIRTLMKYLRQDSIINKVSVLSIVTCVCWEDDLAKKLYSIKNVPQTLMLLFSRLPNSDDLLTQHRAADLCVELLKHEEMVQPFTIYESEQNCAARLLLSSVNSPPQMAAKILEVLLSFCQIRGVRHFMHERIVKCNEPWKALLSHASAHVSRANHKASLLALDLILELCEEAVSCPFDEEDETWMADLVPLIYQQMAPTVKDEDQSVSEILLSAATTKTMKSLQILSCLCTEEELRNLVASDFREVVLTQVIEHQLTHNLTGMSGAFLPEWSNVGIDVVLFGLELVLKLKAVLPGLEKLLYETLQDNRIVPFLASAITSSKRNRVQTALHLHQEALPLPDFPAVLLAEKITTINKQNSLMGDNEVSTTVPHTHRRVVKTSTSMRSVKAMETYVNLPSYTDDKENILSLIQKIQSNDEVYDVIMSKFETTGKTSEIMDIYEHKISSLVTKENHLEDLLEAKTLALAQADRLIAQYKFQRGRCEEDARRMAELLKESEARCEEIARHMRETENEQTAVERELEAVVEDNKNLQNIADQYEQMQSAFQDKSHRVEVLERNLKTSRQEYDTLKELHDMMQKHSEKVKQQHNSATVRLEELEEERLQLMKRISELESSVSDLTQLVEEQDREVHQLRQEKTQCEVLIKKMKLTIVKKDDDIKDLKIKVATLDAERADGAKALTEKDEAIESLRQKLDKQAQTLLMITELSNNIRGSQA